MRTSTTEHSETCKGNCTYCKTLKKHEQEAKNSQNVFGWDETNILL
jgi:hypothetical protein